MSAKDTRGMMQVAVDAVVFTVFDHSLQLLLIKRKNPPFQGKFALPGGFVNIQEELEDAVTRELEEETGVKKAFLQQIGAYGGVARDPRGRILSVAYMALVSPDNVLKAATDAMEAVWVPIDDLPVLAFDHKRIVSDALSLLRYEIQTTNIAVQVMSEKFTLTQLQRLYESVLGKDLDKRNFRKKIKELGLLLATKEKWMGGVHRPALLYMFKDSSYTSVAKKVHVFL